MRGQWYLHVFVEVEAKSSVGTASVGIDLGLKECATTSVGDRLEGRWYRANEKALAVAQGARKKQRVKAIHAKTANQPAQGRAAPVQHRAGAAQRRHFRGRRGC